MELTPEQENAIARLYENESLTENLTDRDAQALLEWAQGQIVANTDDSLVRAAVSAANSSGEQGVQALVTQASTFLAQEVAARDANAARASAPQDAPKMAEPPDSAAAGVGSNDALAVTAPEEMTGRASTSTDARLQASGAAAEQNPATTSISANIGAGTEASTPAPKPRRKKSRKSKRSKKNK